MKCFRVYRKLITWSTNSTLLIRKGARVDDKDCSGATPLHIAALHGIADTVNVLLNMNATVEMKDKMERRRWKSALENASVVSEQNQPSRATTNLNGLVMLICHLLSSGASSWKCKSTEPVAIECRKPFLLFHPLSCLSSTFQENNFASLRNAVNPLTHCVQLKRVRSLRLSKVIQRGSLRIQPFLLAPRHLLAGYQRSN